MAVSLRGSLAAAMAATCPLISGVMPAMRSLASLHSADAVSPPPLPIPVSFTYTAAAPATTPATAAIAIHFRDGSPRGFLVVISFSRTCFQGGHLHGRRQHGHQILQPDVGRSLRLRPGRDHGGDKCLDRFRQEAIRAGY